MKPAVVIPSVLFGIALAVGLGSVTEARDRRRAEDERRAAASAICNRWADDLDRRTTPAGTYVRHDGDTLPASDPWGRPLRVGYSMDGLAEAVEVRSVGPDGATHTADDIVTVRYAANLKGIGTGITNGAEEAARKVARGTVKGLADGAKDVLGRGK